MPGPCGRSVPGEVVRVLRERQYTNGFRARFRSCIEGGAVLERLWLAGWSVYQGFSGETAPDWRCASVFCPSNRSCIESGAIRERLSSNFSFVYWGKRDTRTTCRLEPRPEPSARPCDGPALELELGEMYDSRSQGRFLVLSGSRIGVLYDDGPRGRMISRHPVPGAMRGRGPDLGLCEQADPAPPGWEREGPGRGAQGARGIVQSPGSMPENARFSALGAGIVQYPRSAPGATALPGSAQRLARLRARLWMKTAGERTEIVPNTVRKIPLLQGTADRPSLCVCSIAGSDGLLLWPASLAQPLQTALPGLICADSPRINAFRLLPPEKPLRSIIGKRTFGNARREQGCCSVSEHT